MSASLGLYRLQQVDSQIDRLRAKLDAIQKTLENDEELRQATNLLTAAQTSHHLTQHELKSTSSDAQSQKEKIEHIELSLYSGGIKNPKELQDLQKDSASLKKHLITLEERELEAMVKSETSDHDLENAKVEFEKVQARLAMEHKHLIDDQIIFMKDLEKLAEEREAALGPIDIKLLHIYENLRQQKRGVAVAGAIDNACTSCGTTLSASLQQSAHSQTSLAYCSSCGRILFAN
jgi:predicted  nucleic acid-binding Zn-ribbon protein